MDDWLSRSSGFLCYLRWRYRCLCSAFSWLCKRRRQWRRGGAASRRARGPCTAPPYPGHRCSLRGTGWRTPPPPRCSCRSCPSRTWRSRRVAVKDRGQDRRGWNWSGLRVAGTSCVKSTFRDYTENDFIYAHAEWQNKVLVFQIFIFSLLIQNWLLVYY